ncbi:hypothetical protein ACTFR8_22740 [Bacillus cereus group sp. MYBK15-3]|uniref:hypothetical protein n=1 Tax=unclassified Bacillus cereus group TaxID=2750818 RepID=UPI003F796444
MEVAEKQVNKGYFPDNEPIWLFTDKLVIKQEIEDGLNRPVMLIRTPDDFVMKLDDVRSGGNAYASVILTDSMPPDIVANFSTLVRALKTLKGIRVVEVGIDKVFEDAKRFGTIRAMLKFAQEDRREGQIRNLDTTDTTKDLILGLEVDLNAAKGKIAKLEEEKAEVVAKDKEKLQLLMDMKGQIENELMPDLEKYKEECVALTEKVKKLELDLDIEVEKTNHYVREKDAILREKQELEFKLKGQERYYAGKDEERKRLEKKLEGFKRDLAKLEEEKLQIIRSRVDEEVYAMNVKELDAARESIRDLEEKLTDVQIELSSKSIEISKKNSEIAELRKGSDVLSEVGVSMLLDNCTLERTDVVYIKVFNELPYHRLAIKMLFDMLSERVHGLSHLMILKVDEGLDNKYFKGVPIVGQIGDVKPEDRVFRLFPSRSMFTGYERFSRNVDLLVVVDYTQNDNYYVKSNARETYITMVQRSRYVREFGLKGIPLSLDDDSIFDIKWDSRIVSSSVQENRHGTLRIKVEDWINRLGYAGR